MKFMRPFIFALLLATAIFFSSTGIALAAPQKPDQQPAEKPPKKAKKAKPPTSPQASQEAGAALTPEFAKKEEGPWKGLTWRQIGPFRGGRALAVAGVPGDPNVYYFGAVAGGVWKTTDGGINWQPIADKDKITSVGGIAVAESDPNVIYVGTGEACVRGNIVEGDGVYKSTDAGNTWNNIGLRDSRHIGRVLVHPRNPDIVFIAALGHAFGPNAERGVFRSTDGGKNWQKVLFKDENTGAIDIALDPTNPNIIFAALWQVVRKPYTLESGGPGSGLYKSTDGGNMWKRLEGNGFPKGVLGRIGVTISGANPNRVWALVEAKGGGLFRSDDGGENWRLLNSNHRFTQRAWYYMHVFADPRSADTVYLLNTSMYRSVDGGKTFVDVRAPHGDHHGLWIDPTNPKRMINSNDGGANVSVNAGESWTRQDNQPTAQFYHVIADNRFPYYVYGAQQDNSTVAIASRSDHGVIDRSDWYQVGGCESGYIAPDPRDANIVYAGCYGGHITRFDKRTGQEQEVNAWPENPMGWGAGTLKHRFQWTAPIVISAHDPNVLYHGGEVLFKTTNGGMSWTAISPDLTRNDKSKQQASGGPLTKDNTSVEYYDTIFSVAESSKQKDLIWVGSDDGLVHVTRDGGGHWDNVTPKDLPEWSLISLIEASPHDPATAYLAADRHRLDDFKPYIYRTTDLGKSWSRISDGLPANAVVHAVRQDPVRRDLLYAGTDLGIFISFDDGAHWQSLQRNLPLSPLHDLIVKNNDLVVATHGRSFWILDEISPLRQFNPQIPAADVFLYQPAVTYRLRGGGFPARGPVGQNPPTGAIFYYQLKTALKKPEEAEAKDKDKDKDSDTDTASAPPAEAPASSARQKSEITIEIFDRQGKLVRKYPPPEPAIREVEEFEQPTEMAARTRAQQPSADAGLNRFVWDFRYQDAAKVPNSPIWGGSTRGPLAPAGIYQVKLTVQGRSFTAPLEVKSDPRISASAADLEKQFALLRQIHERLTQAHTAVNQMRDLRRQLQDLNKRLENNSRAKAITDAGKQLENKLAPIEGEIIQVKSQSPQDPLNYPIKINNKLATLASVVESADSAPTQQSYAVFEVLSRALDQQLSQWNAVLKTDLPAFNQLVRGQDIPAIALGAPQAGAAPSPSQ